MIRLWVMWWVTHRHKAVWLLFTVIMVILECESYSILYILTNALEVVALGGETQPKMGEKWKYWIQRFEE